MTLTRFSGDIFAHGKIPEMLREHVGGRLVSGIGR
jgi:hypothetical protein